MAAILKAGAKGADEIALAGLYRASFFKHAAFYGGTALRIFHGLDRFSEDLDFNNFDLTKDMFIKLMNDNQEMMKIIKEQQHQLNTIIPKIGGITNNTTNNHFNLN